MPGFDPAFVARTADAWFGDDEEAARWREWWRLPPATAEKEAVYEEMEAFERALAHAGDVDGQDWGLRLRRMSEVLLSALAAEFADDAGAQTAGASTWLVLLNRRLGEGHVPFRLGHVYPGQRFDPDAMEAVDSLSGNRFLVHRPLSWVVRDLSLAKPRVAQRARVITA
jgi:hypothetical protein